jgi:hypothetical protein
MSKFSLPDNIQIASMQKKKIEVVDLMVPGPGTPWEDIGSIGLFKAFFKTAFGVMFSPGKTLWQVRRPDTTRDATGFALACGFCWALSIAIHSELMLVLHYRPLVVTPANGQTLEIDTGIYWLNTLLQMIAMTGGIWLLLKIINSFYFKLTVLDSHSKASPILTYNVLAYSLAPSLLAVVPIAGPPLAIFWIFVLWIALGMKRLKIKPGGAVIASILTFIATAAITIGVYFAGYYLWTQVIQYQSLTFTDIPARSIR